MRLVEHETPVGRENGGVAASRFRENERVVDDYEVCFRRLLSRAVDEATRVERTVPPAALLAGADKQVALKPFVLVEISVGRRLEPVDEVRHLVLLLLRHRPEPWCEEVANGAEAEVVCATLQKRDLELRRAVTEDFKRARNVGADQLALQVARRRRDDDWSIVRRGPEDRGNKIGERLPDACSRLYHQMLARVECADDCGEHVDLPRAFLVAVHEPKRSAAP